VSGVPVELDLAGDPVELTAALVDIPSVSGDEALIAESVEAALRAQAPHLEVIRSGNSVLARTALGRASRVVMAGHIDTVPVNDNLPLTRSEGRLHGLGTVDMKGGDAIMLHLAATLPTPRHDVTFVFYDCEEIEADRNGLGRIERDLPGRAGREVEHIYRPRKHRQVFAVQAKGARISPAGIHLVRFGDCSHRLAVGQLNDLGQLRAGCRRTS